MDLGKFIDEYVKANSQQVKDALVKKHVVATYVPYEAKMAESKNIVENSAFVTVDGKRKFLMNTPTRYVLFIKAVIILYTDLEWDQTNILLQFNLMEQYGITEEIIKVIGADFEKFQTVLNMTLDDAMTNERSVLSYFENMADAVSTVFEELSKNYAPMIEELAKQYAGNE